MPAYTRLNLLFKITDKHDRNLWAGRRLSGKPWLLRWVDGTGQWITVRELTEQEVEEYQRLAGCYPRY